MYFEYGVTQLLIIRLLSWFQVTSNTLLIALRVICNYQGLYCFFAGPDYLKKLKTCDVLNSLGLKSLKSLKINFGSKGLNLIWSQKENTLPLFQPQAWKHAVDRLHQSQT